MYLIIAPPLPPPPPPNLIQGRLSFSLRTDGSKDKLYLNIPSNAVRRQLKKNIK